MADSVAGTSSLCVLKAVDLQSEEAWVQLGAQLAGATAEFVAIVESQGTFRDGAEADILNFLDSAPTADLLYCDELTLDSYGTPILIAKPDFDPERLRCQFYFGSVVVYRNSFLRELGGLRSALGGAALYDLALRASVAARKVVHLHEALFTASRPPRFGAVRDVDLESTQQALEEHLAATGGGIVIEVCADGVHRTHRVVTGSPLVSIVIPTRGIWFTEGAHKRSFVLEAIRSIRNNSTYSNIEFVVVYDTVADQEILAGLDELCGSSLRLVEWTESFNFSAKINLGVVCSKGEFLLILNDDVEVISPDWIESMLALAQLPGAGMAGCMLYYQDETIQHAGHGYWRGDATHIGMFEPRSSSGPMNGYRVERRVLGVTAACALMPRSVYFEVGGMTSLLPGNFNDVDLCMKVTTAGHEIYWTPYGELYHFESKTRNAAVRKYEVDVAWGRWGSRMHDPRFWPYPV